MIGIILGTRPELIKLFPLIIKLKEKKINYKIVHTGQHYSKNLNENILKKFKNMKIDYNLKIGSFSHSKQVSLMMQKIEKVINKEKFSIFIVYGDTNSALAGALAVAKQKNIKLIHIEAGLRSFEKKMPEEINRIIIDHVSDYLFTPTILASKFCINENINKNKIYFTGNLINDSIKITKKKIKKIKKFPLKKLIKNNYILTTFHREENLTDVKRLKNISILINKLSNYFKVPVVLSCHPHTKKIIKDRKIIFVKNVFVLDPMDYETFMKLLFYSKFVVSDSGGIQEECCILKKKILTIRSSTERQETLKIGGNILVNINNYNLKKIKTFLKKKIKWINPYGNFNVSSKIISNIIKIQKKLI